MILDAMDRLVFGANMGRREVEDMTIGQIVFYCQRYNRYIERQNAAIAAARS